MYLHGELLGSLSDRTVGFVGFDFDEAAIVRHGIGSRVLSLSMPVSWDSVDPFIATAFFSGLLPEGEARQRLTEEFQVSPDDPYGLLELIGRESAGALVIVPSGKQPPSEAEASVRVLDERALAAELGRLTLTPLGVTVDDDEIRLSLAGVQNKLPLVVVVDDDDDALGLPLNGHPSTHIAKPSPTGERGERFPCLVENEAFCLAAVAELGIPTARFRILDVSGENVLLVERYDRFREDGRIRRLHQEDACQAAAINPAFKYESGGGPSLVTVTSLIADHSSQPGRDRIVLFRLTVANLLFGNCDAHGKNISFLHTEEGVRLAPAYDVVSTQAYPHTDRLGMRIDGVERLRDVDRGAVLAQAGVMGLPPRLASGQLAEMAERLPASIDAALTRAQQ
ncbi:MAG: HipA domain-containing protein, partial [Pirellulales bacterium]